MFEDNTAFIVTRKPEEDEKNFLSMFWDISNNMWVKDWHMTQFFKTEQEAESAIKSLARFGWDMTIVPVKIEQV